jgi:hypothetical protein
MSPEFDTSFHSTSPAEAGTVLTIGNFSGIDGIIGVAIDNGEHPLHSTEQAVVTAQIDVFQARSVVHTFDRCCKFVIGVSPAGTESILGQFQL